MNTTVKTRPANGVAVTAQSVASGTFVSTQTTQQVNPPEVGTAGPAAMGNVSFNWNSVRGMSINPLSNPKGVKLTCELCGKPAYIQCKNCRVTYYCDHDHEKIDYRGIHEKICSLLVPLRTPVAVLGSEEERALREKQTRQRQVHLLGLTKTEAHKKLFEGQYDLAIPAALQALRFSMDVYGQNSIELVPSYLLLGEASIGLKQYSQGDEYLSLAKWAVLKSDHCDNAVRSQLHRNLGLLYSSQGNLDAALEQLASDIYYSSLEKGPNHISVTGGYFHLGNVFHKQNRIPHAYAVYDKVVEIWIDSMKHGNETLDEAQQAEAIQILTSVYAFQTNQTLEGGLFSKSVRKNPYDVLYALALVYRRCGRFDLAKEYGDKALKGYQIMYGPDSAPCVELTATIFSEDAPLKTQEAQ
ncbi:uncharacterized protein BJ171DRAFT_456659 [Polychytrium aggregatum]|uniref:uncharacterized protein n=1 Tax=Polychytrium aggregatum TaxID=110093 RepID=UPI0022FEF272|nr:uncharacterized protein BJ171DRAFT_456659 [Polychytrium aggregatum]KAI9206812.1 hypothetical protein BJ171DRAFT_456659 [Polychytrium aggregatum]